MLTLAQAAKEAHMSRRGVFRWIKARLHIEPSALDRAEGERVWHVQRDALFRLLGITDPHLRAAVQRHGKRLDEIDHRVRKIEHRTAAGVL
jgi:hypothetical protein